MKSILSLLMLTSICYGQQPFSPNYDEANVPSYTLPAILKTDDGDSVKTIQQWEQVRRPEILKLFEDNVYGQVPKDFDSLNFTITNETEAAMNGKAKLKEVTINVFRNKQSVSIHLVMFIPRKNTPVKTYLFINNRGKELTDPARKTISEFWPAEMIVDSGFAAAAFHVSDVAPDHRDSFVNGVLRLYPEQMKLSNGMRAVGSWSWGASRVMDYFEKDKDINPDRVAIVGHSRGGKASLWASAQDERFAMCITNNSGNTGAALSRRKFGETVEVINTAFPHWFTPNYKKYNSNENALPVDQHMLIALTAPRFLYATNASKDLWADPTGTYLSLKHAENVYKLYGINSLLPEKAVGINKPVIRAHLAYHNREGIHDLTKYDWSNFLRVAW